MKSARSFENSNNKIEIVIRVDWRKRYRNVADYLCRFHIFPADLLICYQAFIILKLISKLEILFEFDVRFYTKVVQFIMFSYETRIGQRCFSLTADDLVDFNTNTYCLDEISSVACNSGETQTCNYFLLFYFSVEIDTGDILASLWQEEGNFEVLKRCYFQIYPTSFLLMLCKSYRSSKYVKFRVE